MRAHGLRRARYRGLKKVALQNWLPGAACNVKRWLRLTAWEMDAVQAQGGRDPDELLGKKWARGRLRVLTGGKLENFSDFSPSRQARNFKLRLFQRNQHLTNNGVSPQYWQLPMKVTSRGANAPHSTR